MSPSPCLRRWVGAVAAAWLSAGLLCGCAELALVNSVTILATGPRSDPSRNVETNRQTFMHPVSTVYDALQVVVEREGRKIVASDPTAYQLEVAYPFSWLHNNWGGVITVTCTADDSVRETPATAVRVVGGARDAHVRIRKLGDSILRDLADALARIDALNHGVAPD